MKILFNLSAIFLIMIHVMLHSMEQEIKPKDPIKKTNFPFNRLINDLNKKIFSYLPPLPHFENDTEFDLRLKKIENYTDKEKLLKKDFDIICSHNSYAVNLLGATRISNIFFEKVSLGIETKPQLIYRDSFLYPGIQSIIYSFSHDGSNLIYIIRHKDPQEVNGVVNQVITDTVFHRYIWKKKSKRSIIEFLKYLFWCGASEEDRTTLIEKRTDANNEAIACSSDGGYMAETFSNNFILNNDQIKLWRLPLSADTKPVLLKPSKDLSGSAIAFNKQSTKLGILFADGLTQILNLPDAPDVVAPSPTIESYFKAWGVCKKIEQYPVE